MRTYWLIFKPTYSWLGFFLHERFGHCLVCTKDNYNWLILDPKNSHLNWEIPAKSVNDDFPKEVTNIYKYPIIKITMDNIFKEPPSWRFGFSTCVTVVCYIMGLKIKALTPYKLYKKLLEINDYEMDKFGIREISLIGGKFS